MRASYVNPPELLTPLGNWIAERLPYAQARRSKTQRHVSIVAGNPDAPITLFQYDAKADGYMVAFYPFKHVFWHLSLTILGLTFTRRRLFHRHRKRPELRASARHIGRVHHEIWTEVFDLRDRVRRAYEAEQ